MDREGDHEERIRALEVPETIVAEEADRPWATLMTSGGQSIPSGTTTQIDFDSASFNTAAPDQTDLSLITNAIRINVAGLWLVTLRAVWYEVTTGADFISWCLAQKQGAVPGQPFGGGGGHTAEVMVGRSPFGWKSWDPGDGFKRSDRVTFWIGTVSPGETPSTDHYETPFDMRGYVYQNSGVNQPIVHANLSVMKLGTWAIEPSASGAPVLA